MPVTDDGTANGKLLGIVTSRDYRMSAAWSDGRQGGGLHDAAARSSSCAPADTSLKEANDIIWEHKLNSLPIVDADDRLLYMVFRKDYDSHKENPSELLDAHKRYMVGAGINTRDYAERVPALVEAGADVLCIDSSEGYSDWQKFTHRLDPRTLRRRREGGRGQRGGRARASASWPRPARTSSRSASAAAPSASRVRPKGIGRGQATAVIEVAKARDEYFEETGVYIPICSDGGIVHDHHLTLALAMGADFVMLGRYFARFDESPTNKVQHQRQLYEGILGRRQRPRPQLAALRSWAATTRLSFEEGVDSYVPYAGSLKDNVDRDA